MLVVVILVVVVLGPVVRYPDNAIHRIANDATFVKLAEEL